MEFLEAIESVNAEQASLKTLFGGEGRGVRSNRPGDPRYMESLVEASKFMAEVFSGKRPMHHLREVMTTSDFPLLFGDVVDRMLLGNYLKTPSTFRNFMKVSTVPDFRTVKRFAIDGSESILSEVAESAPYPAASLAETPYSYAVTKHGRRIPFSWETIINDDLGAFKDVVERMGAAAARSEEHFATGLFVNSTGPDATFYSAGNANIVTGNPALSMAALQTAFGVMDAQVDSEGMPIFSGPKHLVVPPQLNVVAQNIMNAVEIRALTSGGGISAQGLVAKNWVAGQLSLEVNYFLPYIDTTHGTTAWYLWADPNQGRPGAEVGFLKGHEQPEVFIKSPNASRAGGGGEDPMNGDFDTDSIDYKVRHVFGGTLLDPKASVASTG